MMTDGDYGDNDRRSESYLKSMLRCASPEFSLVAIPSFFS